MTDKTEFARPNFFPGQWIDYQDFNRLARQPDRLMAFVFRHLFEGGGVIVNALEEFAVVPGEGLSVRVKSGVALLPNGQIAYLEEDTLLDLSRYALPLAGRALIVSLRTVVEGTDRYSDHEDPSITGFRAETVRPQFTFGDEADENGIELFRVRLVATTKLLRHPTPREEWQAQLEETADVALIDLRYRKRVIPPTHSPLSPSDLIETRQALYALETLNPKIGRRFLMEDPYHTEHYLSQLHAEMLNRPYQPLKVAFLLNEFAGKQARYLDSMLNRVGRQRSDFDRAALLGAMEILEAMRSREVLPTGSSLHRLPELANQLRRFLEMAEEKFDFPFSVLEALKESSSHRLDFDPKLPIAGHVFERTDLVLPDDARLTSLSQEEIRHKRLIQASFASGDSLELKGSFVKDGGFQLQFAVPTIDRPAVLLMHQYHRREDAVVRYEVNGKLLSASQADVRGRENQWFNRGLFIPADLLLPQGNCLRLLVEQSDLDFGFFDLAVYQPIISGGEGQ